MARPASLSSPGSDVTRMGQCAEAMRAVSWGRVAAVVTGLAHWPLHQQVVRQPDRCAAEHKPKRVDPET